MEIFKITGYEHGDGEDVAIVEIEIKASSFSVASFIGGDLIKQGKMSLGGYFIGSVDYIEVEEVK